MNYIFVVLYVDILRKLIFVFFYDFFFYYFFEILLKIFCISFIKVIIVF